MPFAWARRSYLICGLETRSDSSYRRDNSNKNPHDPWSRHIVFQYTLSGEGAYEDETGVYAQRPGSFFLTQVPSKFCYYLPEKSPSWTFAFMAITHPYVTERIAEIVEDSSALWTVDCQHALVQQAFSLIEAHHARTIPDEIAEEQAIFSWMLEFVRYSHRYSSQSVPSEKILTEVRSHVLAALPRALDVPEIASFYSMSRTHFSHYFRRITGISPGSYMREVRIQYAADLLRQSSLSVKSVASQLGFPDVQTFSKLFRKRFHSTPGQFGRGHRP